MKFLWIGKIVPDSFSLYLLDKNISPSSAYIAQKHLIVGLEEALNSSFDILSSIRVPFFPIRNILYVRSFSFKKKNKGIGYHVGYLNLPILNFMLREFSLYKKAGKWARRNKASDDCIVVIYEMHYPYIKAALRIKKIIPNTKIIMYVPDLPLNMDMSFFIKRILKKIDWVRIQNANKYIDFFALYTKQMAEYLGIKNKNNWVVIEGAINSNNYTYIEKNHEENENKICLYAGNLSRKYNINLLVEAFLLASISGYKLCFIGDGDMVPFLKEMQVKHDCISFVGSVSPNDAFIMMQKAYLLVNPRPSTEEYTLYSCPSKTLEYMASGTPVLSTRLAGIPDEYFKYIYCINDESVEGIKKALLNVLKKNANELTEKGQLAKEFILKHKNPRVQAEKLLSEFEDHLYAKNHGKLL